MSGEVLTSVDVVLQYSSLLCSFSFKREVVLPDPNFNLSI